MKRWSSSWHGVAGRKLNQFGATRHRQRSSGSSAARRVALAAAAGRRAGHASQGAGRHVACCSCATAAAECPWGTECSVRGPACSQQVRRSRWQQSKMSAGCWGGRCSKGAEPITAAGACAWLLVCSLQRDSRRAAQHQGMTTCCGALVCSFNSSYHISCSLCMLPGCATPRDTAQQ